MPTISVNGQSREVNADPAMPLLWVLRDVLGMTGTKFGCGIAQCGACTVHLDGEPIRSLRRCRSAPSGPRRSPPSRASQPTRSHPVQQAWVDGQVPQCGYCQSGQIMSAAALLAKKPDPTDADIDQAMAGNICRCGTYQRIRAAIHRAAELEEELHGR